MALGRRGKGGGSLATRSGQRSMEVNGSRNCSGSRKIRKKKEKLSLVKESKVQLGQVRLEKVVRSS